MNVTSMSIFDQKEGHLIMALHLKDLPQQEVIS